MGFGSNEVGVCEPGRSSMVPKYLLSFSFKTSLLSSVSLEVLLLDVLRFVERLRFLITMFGLSLLLCENDTLLACAHPLIYPGRKVFSNRW